MNNGKFIIKDGALVIEDTGEVISEEEPVFILRGCDAQALGTLRSYQSKMRPTSKCWKGIQSVMEAFTNFRLHHENRMKQPAEAY